MAPKKNKKSNNPAGRPSEDLSEGSVLVTGPVALLDGVKNAAKREGVSVREWWRRAAAERLDRQPSARP